jgi:hypothetical protein
MRFDTAASPNRATTMAVAYLISEVLDPRGDRSSCGGGAGHVGAVDDGGLASGSAQARIVRSSGCGPGSGEAPGHAGPSEACDPATGRTQAVPVGSSGPGSGSEGTGLGGVGTVASKSKLQLAQYRKYPTRR